MSRRACSPHIMVALSLVIGCDRAAPVTTENVSTEKGSLVTKAYLVKGVVRKVKAESGEVTISHEEIPGFMGKMTMPFAVKDKSVLDDVEPGDEVEGPLEVTFE